MIYFSRGPQKSYQNSRNFSRMYKSASMLRETNAGTMAIIHAGFAFIYVVAFFYFEHDDDTSDRISMSNTSLNFADRDFHIIITQLRLNEHWLIVKLHRDNSPDNSICQALEIMQLLNFCNLRLFDIASLFIVIFYSCFFLFINDCYYSCSYM